MDLPKNCEMLSECDMEYDGGMSDIGETFLILGGIMLVGGTVLGIGYYNREAVMNLFRQIRHRPVVANGDFVPDNVPADAVENMFFRNGN